MAEYMSDKEYADADGCVCPNCKGNNVEGFGPFHNELSTISRETKCNGCGATWTELFYLAGYMDLRKA